MNWKYTMLLSREENMQNNLNFLPDECWFGGAVTDGVHQPYTAKSTCVLDLSTNRTPNQMMPLLLLQKADGFGIQMGCVFNLSMDDYYIILPVHNAAKAEIRFAVLILMQ